MTRRTRIVLVIVVTAAALLACVLGLPWFASTMRELHGG
jgi:hypothetical protein